ncbi:hypothetical protein [Dyadobacter psychrophilus]|uniref:Lipoprotein n=1 Tax=Dyadobacter psychrophilus TaxID=651661 RepID=A0A1T5C375_9BACT|nr:hypothetical protein [Dyadobacter psychrophilus]SKB53799.1 hypothetical protein SAMN05660293_00855 [Dyadobacter psychrophilus]
MKKWILFSALSLAGLMSACNDDDSLNPVFISDSAFETGTDEWVAEFAEYSTETDSLTLRMLARRSRLPTGLDTSKYAYMVEASNGSDDMFMYLKKKLTGLNANQTYNISFEVTIATHYPEGGIGAGGAPGGSMFLKTGASGIQPARKLVNKIYEFNLDKGAQSEEGVDAVIIGDATNGTSESTYKLVRKASTKPFVAKANEKGEIWLFVGVDSGYEGINTVYYDRIKALISAQ